MTNMVWPVLLVAALCLGVGLVVGYGYGREAEQQFRAKLQEERKVEEEKDRQKEEIRQLQRAVQRLENRSR